MVQFAWQPYHWLVFFLFIFGLLFMDIFLFRKKRGEQRIGEALLWTSLYVFMALCFNGLIWWWSNEVKAVEFLTGYLIEWSLSMDNVFVFAIIFTFFKVPLKFQHRVLFWGIMGAIVMRFLFILAGIGLISMFDWVMWLFGLLLIYSGVKLLGHKGDTISPDKNLVMKLVKKLFTVKENADNDHFFVRENGKLYITPLFIVLIVIESTDVVFAIDSVPAIFGITRDPFIIFTSNMFAILGLRSLYFVMAGFMQRFRFFSYGLSLILIFVGTKMIAEYWFATPEQHLISPQLSLAVIAGILVASVLSSLLEMKLRKPVFPGELPGDM